MGAINISYGVTQGQYRDIEPELKRPLTLGGIRRRPRRYDDIRGLTVIDAQVRPKDAGRRMRADTRLEASVKPAV